MHETRKVCLVHHPPPLQNKNHFDAEGVFGFQGNLSWAIDGQICPSFSRQKSMGCNLNTWLSSNGLTLRASTYICAKNSAWSGEIPLTMCRRVRSLHCSILPLHDTLSFIANILPYTCSKYSAASRRLFIVNTPRFVVSILITKEV
jgi:hypothetical protein